MTRTAGRLKTSSLKSFILVVVIVIINENFLSQFVPVEASEITREGDNVCVCTLTDASPKNGGYEGGSHGGQGGEQGQSHELSQKVTSLEQKTAAQQQQLAAMMTQQAAKDSELAALHTQVAAILKMLSSALNETQNAEKYGVLSAGGVSYVRWGRTTCRLGADIVYHGFVGGSSHADTGSGSNYLCLPDTPAWNSNQRLNSGSPLATIYGGEYRMDSDKSPFSTVNNGGRDLLYNDVPCVVCHVPKRTDVRMIPALTNCTAKGWHKEYDGFLSAEHHNSTRSSEYICLDGKPETIPGGGELRRSAHFYPVQSVCGSLPCPNYVNGWQLTCVVCTK